MQKEFDTKRSGIEAYLIKNNEVIGSLQSVTYSICREPSPIYTMPRREPKARARMVSGHLVFHEIYDNAEDCKTFDIRIIATNENNERAMMHIRDVQCLCEHEDDFKKERITFVADSVGVWQKI